MRADRYTFRSLIPLAALALLIVGGCGAPKYDPQLRVQADQARLSATLGEKAYTGVRSAHDVLEYGEWLLLSFGKYERLEKLFSNLKNSKADWGLTRPYAQAFYALRGDQNEGIERVEYYLDLWTKHSPESNLPALVRASVLSHWTIDHSTWRDRQDYNERFLCCARAMGALRLAGRDPRNLEDAEYWESFLRTALVSGESAEKLDNLLAEVIKRDPQRWTAYALRAAHDHPVFAGPSVSLEAYRKTVERLTDEHGPEVYAVCAWHLFDNFGRDGDVSLLKMEWPRVKAGFEALRREHPDSRLVLSQEARLAVALSAREDAAALLDEVGEDWDSLAWEGLSYRKARGDLQSPPSGADPKRAVIPVGPEADLLLIPEVALAKLSSEVRSLWREERFFLLEAVASKLREQGDDRLKAFYEGCTLSLDKDPGSKARCQAWSEAVPGSATAPVVLADNLVSSAWDARGGGWASEVSAQGWQRFRGDLELAVKALDKSELPDPYACRVRITVAMGLNQSRADVDKAVARGLELDPQSTLPLHAELVYLLPRWHGESGDLLDLSKKVATKRGPGVLATALIDGNYRDAILTELPYKVVDDSLKAAEAQAKPVRGLAALRVAVEGFYNHPGRLPPALKLVGDREEFWALGDEGYQGWLEAAAGKGWPKAPSAFTLEFGQYRAMLPAALRVSEKGPYPIIPGRSLGIRLRYSTENRGSAWETIILERPDANGEPLWFSRNKRLAPNTVRPGQEELVRWPIEEDARDAAGPWRLSVQINGALVAQETFEMRVSKAPSECGLDLQFQGQVAADRKYAMFTPLQPGKVIPMKIGAGMGALMLIEGMPESVRYRWYPPRGALHENWQDIDTSHYSAERVPPLRLNYYLESSMELVPGTWRLQVELDGRSAGELTWQVKP